MRKIMVCLTLAAATVAGGAALAAGPGPNGRNNFGLCTAYFAGSQNGQDHKHKAPPFKALEAAADAEDMTVAEWCQQNGQKPGGGR